jgi:hypothetical protein
VSTKPGTVHSWAVWSVEGDGDRVGGVVDVAAEVEKVTQDCTVFVGVGEVGVEVFGQPGSDLLEWPSCRHVMR